MIKYSQLLKSYGNISGVELKFATVLTIELEDPNDLDYLSISEKNEILAKYAHRINL